MGINHLLGLFINSVVAKRTTISSNSIKLTKAIAKEGVVKEINSGGFISKYKLKATSSVNNTALKKLVHNELIYKSEDGYIVYDRFMAIWLKE